MPISGHHCYDSFPPRTRVAAYAHVQQEMRTRLALRANGISAAPFRAAAEHESWWCLKGDPMPRFAERDGRTPELLVSGTQVLFSAMALLSAGSVIWVFFQHLLFSQ